MMLAGPDRDSSMSLKLGSKETTAVTSATPVLRVEKIAKSYGQTRALTSCDMELFPGEILAVMGENGSGKSTLVKILTGVQNLDEGTLSMDGQRLRPFSNPVDGISAGIVAVFQEVPIIENQTVLDNIWVGYDGVFRNRLRKTEKRQIADKVLMELLGRQVDLDQRTESLSLSDQQACCIARALVKKPRILILDESTSALDIATRDRLFKTCSELTGQGTSIIFISHRMDEVTAIADRVTVLRSGRTVGHFTRGEATPEVLVSSMTGKTLSKTEESVDVRTARPDDKVQLETQELKLSAASKGINFRLRKGEVVALAGLEGHGQDHFLRALWALEPVAGEVVAYTKNQARKITSPADAVSASIVYVPRDRRTEGIFPNQSIGDNFSIATLSHDVQFGVVKPSRSLTRLKAFKETLKIKMSSDRDPITTLSGGNQQKVVLARWLAADPDIVLLNDPTRGVDLGAKRDIYALMRRMTQQGVSFIVLSTEVDEILEVADRTLVFRENNVFIELDRTRTTREKLVSSFFGHEDSQ
jgi:ABC-type sugar transport system ATPase subunit